MTHPTHDLCSVVFAAGACQAVGLNVRMTIAVAACAAVSARWPDQIEHNFNIVRPWKWKVDWTKLPHWPITIPPLTHRRATHQIVKLGVPLTATPIVATTFAPWIVAIIVAGLATGYLGHLLADGLTYTGIPADPVLRRLHLLPRWLRPSTGTWTEGLFVTILILGIATYTYMTYRADIADLYLRYRP
jgi:hypothetical protein